LETFSFEGKEGAEGGSRETLFFRLPTLHTFPLQTQHFQVSSGDKILKYHDGKLEE
jgi:hypothetical protein